ncbi:MAG: GntR family transcriptional regulator [Blastocatellia bacterium]
MARPRSSFASSRVTLYYQLENLLREKILSGAFGPGERLPTESELIEQYGVSRITVRQSLSTLAGEGLIERRQGRGAVVAARRTQRKSFDGAIHLTGSLDELISMGQDTLVRALEMNRVDADAHEAEILVITPGDTLYRLKRLRLRDEQPDSLIVNYLPADIGSQLSPEELNTGALPRLPETKFALKLRDARQRITAALADPYVAGLLDVRIGAPLLSIERTVFTVEGRPIEYVHTLYRSDLYGYTVYLTRDAKKLRLAPGQKKGE